MQVRLDCKAIQTLVDTSREAYHRWLTVDPNDELGRQVRDSSACHAALLDMQHQVHKQAVCHQRTLQMPGLARGQRSLPSTC